MTLAEIHQDALGRSISRARLVPYLWATGNDLHRALDLYLWDRTLSIAFLADLAILEVALRNALATQLEAHWGSEWFRNSDLVLDDRSLRALNQAWKYLTDNKSNSRSIVSDQVVSQCNFGFWRGLLDQGGHTGLPPRRFRVDYEDLWRTALYKAFPGGRVLAKQEGQRWSRSYAFTVVSRVNDLRNRVAHHESLINGLPLRGQRERDGSFIRLSPEQAHQDTMKLAAMIDRDLHSFLEERSQVPHVLESRPPLNQSLS